MIEIDVTHHYEIEADEVWRRLVHATPLTDAVSHTSDISPAHHHIRWQITPTATTLQLKTLSIDLSLHDLKRPKHYAFTLTVMEGEALFFTGRGEITLRPMADQNTAVHCYLSGECTPPYSHLAEPFLATQFRAAVRQTLDAVLCPARQQQPSKSPPSISWLAAIGVIIIVALLLRPLIKRMISKRTEDGYPN